MITKRNLIDTLQNRLTGGDCPDDLKGLYHPQILEQVIQGVFSDVIANNPQLYRELGVGYSLTRSEQTVGGETKWVADLSVSPLQGSKSVLYVYGCDENDWYTIIQGKYGNHMMRILKPSRCRIGTYYEDGKLVFTDKPHETMTAYIVPNVSDMEDDDEIILPGNDSLFFDACFMILKKMSAPRIENLNDTKEDGPTN